MQTHTIAAISRVGGEYHVSLSDHAVVMCRHPGTRIRSVRVVRPGSLPLLRQRIQYDTVHADSGIVGHRDVIDAYLLNQERSS